MYYPIARPFASPRLRAKIVTGLLVAFIAIATLSMFAGIAESFLPTTDVDQIGNDPIALAFVLATWCLLLIQGLVYLTTAIFFLTFLYRAHENLPALGARKNLLQYSSGWTVGSFFVPFVCLVVPYRAVKELWQRSQPVPEGVPGLYGYQPDPPDYFAVWWLFWILANIGNNVLFRIGDRAEPQSALPLPWLNALVNGIEIGAAVCLMFVVNSIEKRQAETSAQMGLQMTAGPPPPPQFDTGQQQIQNQAG